MAKLKNDPISKPDLLEYLNSYSDFSFELAVLKMLREQGIECEHGGHYEDPVTNKSREFDIRAEKTVGTYRVRMAIECKNIRENFPILISCVPRHNQESYHQVAMFSKKSNDTMTYIVSVNQSRAKTLTIREQHSLYKVAEPVGKSTVQVGKAMDGSITANDSELYDKWGQCLSSIQGLIERSYWDGDEDDHQEVSFSAAFPIVVVPNGRLWTVSYDEDGNRISDPVPTNRCACFVDKNYVMGTKLASTKMWLSHVEIVTFDGLGNFVDTYLKAESGMEKIFPKMGILESLR